MKIIKNNIKFYLAMTMVIILGTIGITYAITIANFNPIAINTTAATIDADITYDSGYSSTITNTGNLLPISDTLITSPNITDTRVLKVKFNVSGVDSNPENTIFDIALYANNIDCELRTKEVKWRLYRSTTLISEGNLSPTFDTMANNRLVLTNTQEDLTTTSKDYTFLLWISESCTGDITNCDPSLDQTKYLNKNLSGAIKIELSTKSKKTLTRTTGSELSCDYTAVTVPICNQLTYNGSEQELVDTSSSTLVSNNSTYKVLPLGVTTIADTTKYTINNNIGINAGSYPVILSLSDGYKWTDGSTDDKCIYCSIKKKDLTITTLNQSINYGNNISNTSSNYTTSSLVSGHTLSSVSLTTNIADVGTSTISSSNAKILDSSGTDVTNNYNIKYQNTGTVTINCIKSSVMPTSSDKLYTGSSQTGITGGTNVNISGTKSATLSGKYSVVVTPNKNYCWSDGTTTSKTLYWNIKQTYTISYNANGGTGAPSSQTKVHGETLTLSNTTPTRDGYNFLGWSTSKTASSPTYTSGASFTTNSNITLYAVYKANYLIEHITNLYTSGNPTLITQETSNDTYYYSYQDSTQTWGLMNDGLTIDTTQDEETTGLAKVVTDTNALTSGTQGNIRYFGPSDSVNNYIYFNCDTYPDTNCELWRIIGIVDGKVKIIRNDSIGSLAWDQDKNQDSSLTTYSNNWKTSSLQLFLNGLYYNRGTTEELTYYSGSDGAIATTLDLTTIGITEATRNNKMISSSIWYLAEQESYRYPNDKYVYERINSVGTTIYSGNPFTIYANIGLMYASDCGYGTDLTKCSQDVHDYGSSYACRTNNWLYNGAYQWIIATYQSNTSTAAKFVYWDGTVSVGGYEAYTDHPIVRPTLYLNTKIVITSEGEGTSTNPYRISIG